MKKVNLTKHPPSSRGLHNETLHHANFMQVQYIILKIISLMILTLDDTLSLFYKRQSIRDGRQIFEKNKRGGLGFSKNLRDSM